MIIRMLRGKFLRKPSPHRDEKIMPQKVILILPTTCYRIYLCHPALYQTYFES